MCALIREGARSTRSAPLLRLFLAAWRRGAALLAASTGLSFAVGAATVDLAELSGDVILADGATVTLSGVYIVTNNIADNRYRWAGIGCVGYGTASAKGGAAAEVTVE